MELAFVVFTLSLGVSLLSGLVGIGGGIVLAPALLHLPHALGLGPLDMWQVTGLTVTQGLAACLSGGLRHDRDGRVHRHLVVWMGGTLVPAALAGALLSRRVDEATLKILFAGLAVLAAGLMCLPRPIGDEEPGAEETSVWTPVAVALALVVGFLGGLVGQAGGFLLVPLLIHVLGLPTRVAIGSNLAMASSSSLAGFAGKAYTGQIPWLLAVAVAAGAIPGAWLGGVWSSRFSPRSLRWLLAVVLLLSAARIASDAF